MSTIKEKFEEARDFFAEACGEKELTDEKLIEFDKRIDTIISAEDALDENDKGYEKKTEELFEAREVLSREEDKYLQNSLHKTLLLTKTLDENYIERIKKLPYVNHAGYRMLFELDKDNAPLEDCYTALTFCVRVAPEDMPVKGVYRALVRVCKLLN